MSTASAGLALPAKRAMVSLIELNVAPAGRQLAPECGTRAV
jgi:hypothetical protein